MYRYVSKRLLMMIPVLIGVTFMVFCIMDFTPGDPAQMILGDAATKDSVAQLREELGLNGPLLERYFIYMKNFVTGDMGISYKNGASVAAQIFDKLPNTLMLASAGTLIAVCIGIPMGIISARKQYTMFDNFAMLFALIGTSMPSFWLGLLLVIAFSLNLGIFPASGMGMGGLDTLRSLVLPALTIGTGTAAVIARMTRSSMLEVIRQEYIDTARAKGLKESKVVYRHMLKNALIPIVTVIGLQFGLLLGGSVMTESVFSWPGLGRFVLEAIKMKDTPVVMGCVIVLSILFSCVNFCVDILYAFIDPRIKSQYKKRRISNDKKTKD